MLRRAFSLLELKSVDDEQRVIHGIATTPTPDRMDDVVDPLGAEVTGEIPFLWQHQSREAAVGHVTLAQPTADGIPVRIQMERDDEPGLLRDRLEYAWRSIKKRLVRGLSIGFRPLETAPIKGSYGMRIKRWEWVELSAVTIPAQVEATITAVKAAAEAELHRATQSPAPITAAPGAIDRRSQPRQPGVTGGSQPRRTEVGMKSYAEKIRARVADKEAKIARQNEIMSRDDGTTLAAAEQEEFDTLQGEIVGIDQELARLEQLEHNNKANARPVAGTTPEEGLAARAPAAAPVVTVRANREPGIGFARTVLCRALGFLTFQNPYEIAKARFPDDLEVQLFLKAAVGAGTTAGATNAAPLAYLRDLPEEFMKWVRPLTIIGRIPKLRSTPFNVRMVGQTSGGSAGWVGEAKPKPLTKFDFAQSTLGIAKLAAIAVISDELAMLSAPSAESVVRDSLGGAIVQQQDHDFIDPAITEIANVRPASITNAVTPLVSSGTDAAAVVKDIRALLDALVVKNPDPSGWAVIMPNTLALTLSLMQNALGQNQFPSMSVTGGSLNGIPVVASQAAAFGAPATTAGNLVIALNAPDILLADDGSVAIDVNRTGALEMSDAPTQDGAAGTGASLVSLWQNNLLAIRAERHINWKKRRPEAVAYMEDVAWGS